jgi:uncharacterized membrane protein YphA (DoxX/SURF4 family)
VGHHIPDRLREEAWMPEALFPLWPWMHLVGRTLFGMLFIGSGLNHLFKANDMAAYAQSKGVPGAKAVTIVSGLMIVVGGVFIMLGWHRFIGAGLIVLFLLPTAFVMHAFWKESDPAMMQIEMSHFMKDLALLGAALFFAFYAAWSWPMSVGG